MKSLLNPALIVSLTVFSVSASLAHDPSEHTNKAEKPDCKSINTRDKSTLDMTDPVVMAMMSKCKSSHNKNADDHHANGDQDKASEHGDKHSKGSHNHH
jgi:hypothetical protein